jgi:hypothetical protein
MEISPAQRAGYGIHKALRPFRGCSEMAFDQTGKIRENGGFHFLEF